MVGEVLGILTFSDISPISPVKLSSRLTFHSRMTTHSWPIFVISFERDLWKIKVLSAQLHHFHFFELYNNSLTLQVEIGSTDSTHNLSLKISIPTQLNYRFLGFHSLQMDALQVLKICLSKKAKDSCNGNRNPTAFSWRETSRIKNHGHIFYCYFTESSRFSSYFICLKSLFCFDGEQEIKSFILLS